MVLIDLGTILEVLYFYLCIFWSWVENMIPQGYCNKNIVQNIMNYISVLRTVTHACMYSTSVLEILLFLYIHITWCYILFCFSGEVVFLTSSNYLPCASWVHILWQYGYSFIYKPYGPNTTSSYNPLFIF